MSQFDNEEYEEVESPFARQKSSRGSLRSRQNVFNRPMGADPVAAPAVIETTSTKKLFNDSDFRNKFENRQSDLNDPEIDYLEEESSVVEKRPVRSSSKKNAKSSKNLLPKILWGVIGALVLRLVFMDRGVWDYFATEATIKEKRSEFQSIQNENKELKTEINRIQLDQGFQRQLAKEHLGVIAVDEFLILFAGESSETKSKKENHL